MGTDLRLAKLDGATLYQARLSGANLMGATLMGADLRGAELDAATLMGADLRGAKLDGATLTRADLTVAKLDGATLMGAGLMTAILQETDLREVGLLGADLRGVDLTGADLRGLDLSRFDLSNANLSRANLQNTLLINTNLSHANLTGCLIHGVSVWNTHLTDALQADLIITPEEDPVITVDDLEVAQFIYLLLSNEKIRNVIDTITSKVVLILGRFTDERKAVLDALRNELRKHNYLPILFDFDKPVSKDVTGTVETLARMARFIVADLTDPSSIPHELATIVPFLRTTPILPLRRAGSGGYSMFDDYQRAYALWVLTTYEYTNEQALIAALPDVIAPAEKRAHELRTSP